MKARTGFHWHGHFDKTLGYGEEARQFVFALQSNNMPVKALTIHLNGTFQDANQESKQISDEFFTKFSPSNTSFERYISVSHSIPSLVFHDPHATLNVVRCMFETDHFPDNWKEPCSHMDEIWVPSDFNLQTFTQSKIPREKLFKLPGTIDTQFYSPDGPAAELIGEKRFIFFSMFEWTLRKGWDILVESFLQEFSSEEPVLLLIKTWTTQGISYKEQLQKKLKELGRNSPPILLVDPTCLSKLMPTLYRAVHCFVLPSHGEGWGRPYMEAMSCGLPTIATGWSGNTEFMNRENSFLLDYELTPVPDQAVKEIPTFEGHRWASVDKNQLREYMRYIYKNYANAKEVGLKARTYMIENFSYQPIAKILQNKLEKQQW